MLVALSLLCKPTIHSGHSCADLNMLILSCFLILTYHCVLTATQIVHLVVIELKAIISAELHFYHLLITLL